MTLELIFLNYDFFKYTESTPLIKNDEANAAESTSCIKAFLCAISPVDTLQWKQSGFISKCIAVIKVRLIKC